jgi:HSP20 family protein
MTAVCYEPWNLMNQLHGEFGRLNARMHPSSEQNARQANSEWVPAVDIREETDRYIIHADVPGVKPEDVEVDMVDGVLSVKGQRYHESEESGEGFRRMERSRGRFSRRFSLPDSVNADAISARMRDGVLEIVIPKQEKLQPKRIPVAS